MIALALLLITIGGISATPNEKSILSNINDSDLDNLNRNKRSSTNSTILNGDQYSFSFNEPDSEILIFPTALDREPIYHYNKFRITTDLNYTSWDELLSNYSIAGFNEKIHIEFSRSDGKGRIVDKRVLPRAIKFSEIKLSEQDIEKYNDRAMRILKRDLPFHTYSQLIFEESICVDAAKVNAKIHLSLEGFKNNNELILRVIFKLSHSFFVSSSGIHFHMRNYNQLVLE